MHRSVRALTLGIVAAFVITAAGTERVEARNPADVFAGKVITSAKRLPTRAKSKRAYIRKIKKRAKRKFREDEENKRWKIYFAAFFKRPLNDLEVTIKLYDVTKGKRHLVSSFNQYLDRRGQRSVVSYLKLEREEFGVNKKILMVVENRGRTLAAGRFRIFGKAKQYDGKVTFSKEEAAKGADED